MAAGRPAAPQPPPARCRPLHGPSWPSPALTAAARRHAVSSGCWRERTGDGWDGGQVLLGACCGWPWGPPGAPCRACSTCTAQHRVWAADWAAQGVPAQCGKKPWPDSEKRQSGGLGGPCKSVAAIEAEREGHRTPGRGKLLSGSQLTCFGALAPPAHRAIWSCKLMDRPSRSRVPRPACRPVLPPQTQALAGSRAAPAAAGAL